MGKKSVEANSNNKQCENDTIVIERFSKKRYETYKAKGIPFKVVCGSGRLCVVKAFDCGVNHDQMLVESPYKFLGKDDISLFYANQKDGSTQFLEGKLSIYRGPWFKHNDLVLKTIDGIAGREIFFWHGINTKDNMIFSHLAAYSPYDDMHDSEFHPGTTGSLGCAISEAVEVATTTEGYRYVLGSVLNQVLLHQSVIGLEAKAALDKLGVTPDIIIGCAGGGSNLGGLISPFMGEKLRGEKDYRIIAVEPASCPSLTRGKFAYDFCDTGMVCPLAKMYTLGSGFIPSANHAGGLRYHGMSSTLSQLYHDGLMEATSVEQTSVFEAAEKFARVEGILPAPESSHAIRVAIDEALKCKETGEEKTILFGLTGTGYFDMMAYEKYNDGVMSDYIPTDEDLKPGFDGIPKFPGNEF